MSLTPSPRHFPDESWLLQAGGSSGELSGSGEAQADAPWWSQRLQMALVNTVAFRGVWQKQFQFSNTQNLPFTLSDGSTIKVPMMHQATEVSFGETVPPAVPPSTQLLDFFPAIFCSFSNLNCQVLRLE